MKLLDRLERPFRRYAVTHVTVYLIALQVIGYIALQSAESQGGQRAQEFYQQLPLDKYHVLQLHEWWRLISFLLIPGFSNPLFFFLGMYFLWIMGTALEDHWGAFRYNVYLLTGYLLTVAAVFLLPIGWDMATNTYLLESIFLAFAYLYPDFVIYMFFVFPVKMKWLAVFTWFMLLMQFLTGEWLTKGLVLAATGNFLLFFHRELWMTLRGSQRRMKQRMDTAAAEETAINRCIVCGVTEKANRKMEFRYCPECTGTPCYCMDHFTGHKHRQSVKV